MGEVAAWYKKRVDAKEPDVDPNMADGYAQILKKFKSKDFKDEEVFLLNDSEQALPIELQK